MQRFVNTSGAGGVYMITQATGQAAPPRRAEAPDSLPQSFGPQQAQLGYLLANFFDCPPDNRLRQQILAGLRHHKY